MRRWILACLVLLTFSAPVAAERRQPPLPADQPTGEAYLASYRFPAIKSTVVETQVDPHTRTRLTVAGSDWSFSLVFRRWGWEVETILCPWDVQRALAFASLDYLNGQPQALSIFLTVPPEYVQTLMALSDQRPSQNEQSGLPCGWNRGMGARSVDSEMVC